VEAEAPKSSQLQSRSLPNTLCFQLGKHSDAKSALHRNSDQLVRLSYILNY
jgi:hypothetical protein